MSDAEGRFFSNKEDIMKFLGIGKEVFDLFLKLKMPVICINGRYYGYSGNIVAWFEKLTATQKLDVEVKNTL